MKPNAKLYLLTGMLLVMVVITASLIRSNYAYQRTTRTLVLQNDSIMAVNIELRHSLRQETGRQRVANQKSSRLP